MRTLTAYLLAITPLLTCAHPEPTRQQSAGLVINSLPICRPGELLGYTDAGLDCLTAPPDIAIPDCKTNGQVLTYTAPGLYSCTSKGSEGLTAADVTTINTTYSTLVSLNTPLTALMMGGGPKTARYCGSTATTTGRFTHAGSGSVGLAAASAQCAAVAGCGTGARICSVYDMHRSVSLGVIPGTSLIAKSWVYMGSWQNFNTSAVEPTAGLSDNCGSYTHASTTNNWYGTAVKWVNGSTGYRMLKFYTGPDRTGIGTPVGNYEGAPCDSSLPIACCR